MELLPPPPPRLPCWTRHRVTVVKRIIEPQRDVHLEVGDETEVEMAEHRLHRLLLVEREGTRLPLTRQLRANTRLESQRELGLAAWLPSEED